jgi:twitching motility protein PilI
MAERQAAFQALVDLAYRSKRSAKGLPAQQDITPHWSGVGFSLLNCRFVAPMGIVSEMLEVPPHTHLPGVQPWVRGVANVRGRLLPLFDMAAFFGERMVGSRKQRRVLILETESLYSGLIVDQVFGMQHFPIDTFSAGAERPANPIQSYVVGSYYQDDCEWWVMNPLILAEDTRFANAALG